MTFVFSVVVVLGIAARVLPPAETEYAQAAAPAHVNEKGVCVVIDPGHGGDDEGAIGENGTAFFGIPDAYAANPPGNRDS